jgi:hypothetical protein
MYLYIFYCDWQTRASRCSQPQRAKKGKEKEGKGRKEKEKVTQPQELESCGEFVDLFLFERPWYFDGSNHIVSSVLFE